jgi:HAD superfamily hydrolase (TIGR01459 family)
MQTVAPPRIPGLSSIVDRYEALVCDVWGVIHDGLALFPGVDRALIGAREAGAKVLLLTNAPRPAAPIHEMLARFGLPREAYDDVLTSGMATTALLAAHPLRKVIHIGPERDLGLYDGTGVDLVDDAAGELVVVTGLFDDDVETPEDYRARLAGFTARGLPMICANPDIVVQRGERPVWCAGALAGLYREIGGTVRLIGKPHGPIYDEVRRTLAAMIGRPPAEDRILAVGDGLPTDIRGAHGQGWDVLFVTGGIHGPDFGPVLDPDPKKVEIRLLEEGLAATAMLPRLVW